MKKNVSSQFIGAQMTYLASGTPVVASGAVLTYLRADGLPMQLGAVNSGICIPNSYGLHHYIPAQSETNYDWLSFTFVASGAPNFTAQMYTMFPQTGDGFTSIGSVAAQVNSNAANLSSLHTRVSSVDVRVSSLGIQLSSLYARVGEGAADTPLYAYINSIGMSVASLHTRVSSVGVQVGSLFTLGGSISTQAGSLQAGVDAIGLKTVNLPPDPADASDIAGAFAVVNASVSSLDTRVSSVAAQVNSTFTMGGSLSTAVGSLSFGVNIHRINSDANAAGNLRRGTLGTTLFTAGGGSTTTLLSLSALSPAAAVADQFKGRIITFDRDTLTANLRGQATDILSNSALGLLGVTALTNAPSSGDTGTIT